MLTVLAAGGCATTAPRGYIAATNETVTAEIEQLGPAPGHVIYLENRSTVPVTVYSLTLRSCENVKQECEKPVRMNVKVRPGHRSTLQRVLPDNIHQRFRYSYSYGWRADSGITAALGVMAEGGSEHAAERLAAVRRAEAARRAEIGVHDEFLTNADIDALSDRVSSIRMEPDSLVMSVGDAVTLDQIRLILLGRDGERLGRVRHFGLYMRMGTVTLVRPDTLRAIAPGRVEIDLTLPDAIRSERVHALGGARITIVVRE
jgi:hypothetical protein